MIYKAFELSASSVFQVRLVSTLRFQTYFASVSTSLLQRGLAVAVTLIAGNVLA